MKISVKELVEQMREVVADGDAHGTAAAMPTSIGVRNLLEKSANVLEKMRAVIELEVY